MASSWGDHPGLASAKHPTVPVMVSGTRHYLAEASEVPWDLAQCLLRKRKVQVRSQYQEKKSAETENANSSQGP